MGHGMPFPCLISCTSLAVLRRGSRPAGTNFGALLLAPALGEDQERRQADDRRDQQAENCYSQRPDVLEQLVLLGRVRGDFNSSAPALGFFFGKGDLIGGECDGLRVSCLVSALLATKRNFCEVVASGGGSVEVQRVRDLIAGDEIAEREWSLDGRV